MNVFISWSGPKSRAAALALRDWLQLVLHAVKPWMSAEDIEAGARWSGEISKQLESTTFGIICLTKANQNKPWIMFEAGALAKTLQGTFVVPYLIDLEPAEVEAGPLSQFQVKRANKAETWQLLVTLNRALASPLTEEQLRRIYDKFWGDLEAVLNNLPTEDTSKQAIRSREDMLEEVLLLVRGIAQYHKAQNEPIIAPRDIWLSQYAGSALVERIMQDPLFDSLMRDTPHVERPNLLDQYLTHNYPSLKSDRRFYIDFSQYLLSYYTAKLHFSKPKSPRTSGLKSPRKIIEGDEAPQADASDEKDPQAQ